MKTKIICTIGPATNGEAMIEALANAGMNIARVNCSHGTAEQSRELIRRLQRVREQKKLNFQIMLDTKGPDVRIGTFEDGHAVLRIGQEFILTANKIVGNRESVFAGITNLAKKVQIGNEILMSDGKIRATVTNIIGADVYTTINVGGIIANYKTMYVRNVDLDLPFLSNADKEDLRMGVEESVDIVAASFVSSAEDVHDMKAHLTECCPKCVLPQIIAKIESSKGFNNLDEILKVVDGIMVARGDLGVEYRVEKIPTLQRAMVAAANEHNKFVIVATELMESMIKNARPTRAEVADVALAVWQGASAVMLSAETAVGEFPIKAVQYMRNVAIEAEESGITVSCVCNS